MQRFCGLTSHGIQHLLQEAPNKVFFICQHRQTRCWVLLCSCFKKKKNLEYTKTAATYKRAQPDESTRSRWEEAKKQQREEEEEEEEVSRRCRNTWPPRGLISPERFCSLRVLTAGGPLDPSLHSAAQTGDKHTKTPSAGRRARKMRAGRGGH